MLRGFVTAIAMLILAIAALTAGTAPAFAFDAKKADQSVVRVIVWEVKNGKRTGTYGSGTGFVVADEYVVTNEHVTDDSDYRKDGATAERVVVALTGGRGSETLLRRGARIASRLAGMRKVRTP